MTAVRELAGGTRRFAVTHIDRTQPVPPARHQIDNEYYEGIDELWWDPSGPAAVLHAMNGPRLGFYLRALCLSPPGTAAPPPRQTIASKTTTRKKLSTAPKKGALVLDAGCGGGLVAKGLAEAGATVVGLDRSAGSLGVARRAVASAGGAGAGRFAPVRGRLERLPFDDQSFDAVVAADVLEHVGDLPAVVAEIARVLAPGGGLAFDTINRTAWAWITALWGAERLLGCIPRGTHDWRLFIRPAELDRLLRRAGLEPVTVVGLAPRVGPRIVARALTRRRIPVPEFATGRGRRASYLGHYRKAVR
jgi:2-polyprenyl-6-hydroxyphenyl methylase/3-demethylubiquinone-9 3-methyltransferase